MKTLHLKGISMFIVIIIILTSCTNNISDEKAFTNNDFSGNKIKESIFLQQNENGGFREIDDIKSSLYLSMYDTYYALGMLHELGMEISDLQLERLKITLESLDENDIVNGKSSEDLSNVFYYFEILKLINYEGSIETKSSIIDRVSKLQSEEGYFYSSQKTKMEHENNNVEYDIDDSIVLISMQQVSAILKGNRDNVNLERIKKWMDKIYEVINLEEVDEHDIGSLVTYLEVDDSFNLKNNKFTNEQLKNYYSDWIEFLSTNEVVDIHTVYNLYVLSKFVDIDNIDFLKQYLRKYEVELSNGSVRYSISPKEEFYHIAATYDALRILNDGVTIRYLKKDATKEELPKISYDGTFEFIRDTESDIFSTYYAANILRKFVHDKSFPNQQFIEYIESNLKDNLFKKSTPEILMILQLANQFGVKTDMTKINEFFDKQFQITYDKDYEKNNFLILLLIETANAFDYEIKDKYNKNLINQASTHQLSSSLNNSTSLSIIFKCIDLSILNYLDSEPSTKEIDKLIKSYIENYDNLKDDNTYRLYVTYYFIKCLKQYEINADAISKEIIEDLLLFINKGDWHGFYLFQDSIEDYESTYMTLEILQYIN